MLITATIAMRNIVQKTAYQQVPSVVLIANVAQRVTRFGPKKPAFPCEQLGQHLSMAYSAFSRHDRPGFGRGISAGGFCGAAITPASHRAGANASEAKSLEHACLLGGSAAGRQHAFGLALGPGVSRRIRKRFLARVGSRYVVGRTSDNAGMSANAFTSGVA
jgi:hypothetical protein